MFLSRRTTQAEYFDSARPLPELTEFFRSLGRMNRLFGFATPYQSLFPKLLGEENCRSLTILDIGAGDGSLGKTLGDWAARRSWSWRVVNLDCSLPALTLNGGGRNVAGSAMLLPFRQESFDVVIASQMAHHLQDDQAARLLQEAWRVARKAILLCDLHRNLGLYCLLRLVFCFQSHSAAFRSDALLSVERGWRAGELAQVAAKAAIHGAKVELHFGARIVLHARKDIQGLPADPTATQR